MAGKKGNEGLSIGNEAGGNAAVFEKERQAIKPRLCDQ